MSPHVVTWKSRQFQFVERQRDDFSCGAASLATIAKYFLNKDVSESDVTEIVRASYDDQGWKSVQLEGLRLLDVKNAAIKLGLSAEGYRMSLADVGQLKGPALVHLSKVGYKHFSVLKGIVGDRVWLADPIRGNIRLPVIDFLREWTGVVLLVWDPLRPVAEQHRLRIIASGTPSEYDVARSVLNVRFPEALILR